MSESPMPAAPRGLSWKRTASTERGERPTAIVEGRDDSMSELRERMNPELADTVKDVERFRRLAEMAP